MLQVKKYTRNRPIINRTIPLPMQILELCMKINIETKFYADFKFMLDMHMSILISNKSDIGKREFKFLYSHACVPDDNMYFNGGHNKRVHEVIEDLKYIIKHNEIKPASNGD